MTTKTDTEQERAEFEAWADDQGFPLQRTIHGEDYQDLRTQGAFEAYQAGRAALQSQPMETSSTIRYKSYAGVYVWLGDKNIVEHIPKAMTENAINPGSMMAVVVDNAISKLGRFVALQSQDREDAERLDWLEARAHDSSYATQIRLLRDPAINAGMNRIEVRTGVGSGVWERPTEGHNLREAIDHARHIEGGGE